MRGPDRVASGSQTAPQPPKTLTCLIDHHIYPYERTDKGGFAPVTVTATQVFIGAGHSGPTPSFAAPRIARRATSPTPLIFTVTSLRCGRRAVSRKVVGPLGLSGPMSQPGPRVRNPVQATAQDLAIPSGRHGRHFLRPPHPTL